MMVRHRAFLLAACLQAAGAPPALAQIGVPGLPPITLPTVPPVDERGRLRRSLDPGLAADALVGARRAAIDRLLRAHPRTLARDPAGEPVVRGELLAIPSSQEMLAAILAAGFTLLRESDVEGLDARWLVLGVGRQAPAAALARLRALDPAGHYDHHHLYTGSGDADASTPSPLAAAPRSVAATGKPEPASTTGGEGAPVRIGLVDTGLDWTHPALRRVALREHGCADGLPHPSAHGTAVASLLAGRDGVFRGAHPEAALHAVDVYCGAPTGGSAEQVARGLAWLARERIAVINISLVGPANVLLERVVAALVGRGHLLVAPVGNDGPAAAPLYPASWPGVVGVTGTDSGRRLLPEAGRGPQVMFAAPGADLAAAASRDPRFVPVRGTSFAAPTVAGLLAARLAAPGRDAAAAALAALSALALDLGPAGRDPGFGQGLVGDDLRIDPRSLQLARLP